MRQVIKLQRAAMAQQIEALDRLALAWEKVLMQTADASGDEAPFDDERLWDRVFTTTPGPEAAHRSRSRSPRREG